MIDGEAANPANFHPLIVVVMIMKWTERGSFKYDFSQSHSDADYIIKKKKKTANLTQDKSFNDKQR